MTILELVKIFLRFKNKIILITAISCIFFTFLYFFVFKPVYISQSTVKTSSQIASMSSLLSGAIPDLSEFGDFGGSGAGKELALLENILLSRRIIENAIIKFKLNDEWEFKYMQDAIKNFRKNVITIEKDKIAGTMLIGIYDENPVRAKEILDFMINELNSVNTEINVQDAKNNREFIEARYYEVKKDLTNSEDSLKIFQDKYGVAPDLVIKSATTTLLQLEAEIKSEEIKLDILKKIISSDQPEIQAQVNKIEAMYNQLNEIKSKNFSDGNLNLKGAPDIALNFLRLTRNLEIQNKILTFIVPMLEQAKIEEKKNMPSVLIIDAPYIPEYKVKPKRIISILGLTFVTFIIVFSFFIIKFKWANFRNKIGTDEYFKL